MAIRVGFDAVAYGRVNVGYYEEDGIWYALAREFDLLGSGRSHDAAFEQLQELVADYVEECIMWGVERFFNPTPAPEWRQAEQHEQYVVTLVFARYSPRQKAPPQVRGAHDLTELTPFKQRFAGAALAAV